MGSELDENVHSNNENCQLPLVDLEHNQLESEERSVGRESALFCDADGQDHVSEAVNDRTLSSPKPDVNEKKECKG